jgi:hypothetical protein
MLPACVGQASSKPFRIIVALAAEFHHEGDSDGLLARFGTVSAMRGLRYWSATEKSWRVLIKDAAALEGMDGQRRRPDFTPGEMKRGVDLFFAEEDNRSSAPVTYRLRILERGPDRLVIETANVSPVRAFRITFFPPGSLRATYFFDRRHPDVWSFYGLSAISQEASALAAFYETSYINRAATFYRYLIGVPTDRDPPLAP